MTRIKKGQLFPKRAKLQKEVEQQLLTLIDQKKAFSKKSALKVIEVTNLIKCTQPAIRTAVLNLENLNIIYRDGLELVWKTNN